MKLGIIRLYVGESGKFGYYNIQELGLAKSLAKKGVTVDIFFLVDKNENKDIVINDINEKIRIIYIPAGKVSNHGIVSPKFILEYGIEVVHLLSDNQLMVPSFIKFCNKNNIPIYNYVGTISSDTNNKIKKIVMDILVKRNIRYFKKSTTIAKTETVKKQLINNKVDNVKVIPVGLDLDIIPQIDKSKNEIRKELNIEKNKKVLIFVGRLEEYKNPIMAIELINELRKVNKDYLLVIIGDGALKTSILELISRYDLKNNIIYIDKIENLKIHNYYKASDIFINFNNKEIFGMSILEAMYQGCNVIAIEAPGPKCIIENNVDGIILNDFMADNWIKAINNNWNNTNMSNKAIKKIRKNFVWDNIADKYVDLFNSLKGE